RLLGYETRHLAARDFNDDSADGGELGAGHAMTALYELAPIEAKTSAIDPLKYDGVTTSSELLTVKVRYKLPNAASSERMEIPVLASLRESGETSRDLRLASAVSTFAMALRRELGESVEVPTRLTRARTSLAGVSDPTGRVSELVQLMKRA